MNSTTYSYEQLKAFCSEAFNRFGFNVSESQIITDVLLLSDLYGIESHGTNRIVMIHQQIKDGYIDIHAQPKLIMETPISAVIDGQRGMGQLVSDHAMKIAMQKAKTSGIGLVTVRNSNHYGIAGYYSLMACKEGLIGVSMTNSLAAVVPTFGKAPMMGTNPFAFSFPANPQPFNFDAATSVVSVGKIEIYNKLAKQLPLGWGMNSEGNDETEPSAVLKSVFSAASGLHPLGGGEETFGGHKGYGFSMVVEILCSILSLGTTSNHVETVEGQAGVSHFFAAIDPKIFGDPMLIQQHLETYLSEIRSSEKREGQDRIYTHGEKEAEAYTKRIIEGIPVNDKTIAEIRAMAAYLAMDFDSYFS